MTGDADLERAKKVVEMLKSAWALPEEAELLDGLVRRVEEAEEINRRMGYGETGWPKLIEAKAENARLRARIYEAEGGFYGRMAARYSKEIKALKSKLSEAEKALETIALVVPHDDGCHKEICPFCVATEAHAKLTAKHVSGKEGDSAG